MSDQLSRREFLKLAGAMAGAPFLEAVPPPPKEQYTNQEWFDIRAVPERAVDTVVTRGFAGIGLPVIKRDIAAIEGNRTKDKESPLKRVFPTYSLVKARQALEQLKSSVLFDVTLFFLPQLDPSYVLPVSWQRVDIDPKTGVQRPGTTQYDKLYIPGETIQLGQGLLGEVWEVKTTEEWPPNLTLDITWVGKRTPFEIDTQGKLVFNPTKAITFSSELKQEPEGNHYHYERFGGVSPSGVLYLPVEISMTPPPQPQRPKGVEA